MKSIKFFWFILPLVLLEACSFFKGKGKPAHPSISYDNPTSIALRLTGGESSTATTPGNYAAAHYGNSDFSFEVNQGQEPVEAYFTVHGLTRSIRIDRDTLWTSVLRDKKNPQDPNQYDLVKMNLIGTNPSAEAVAFNRLSNVSHYYTSTDSNRWLRDVPNFRSVMFKNIYPNIDLVYYGQDGRLKYDFIVNPGGDFHSIAFNFSSQAQVIPKENGDLSITLENKAKMTHRAPVIYQLGDNGTGSKVGHYTVDGTSIVKFEIEDYDRSQVLVIDPVIDFLTTFPPPNENKSSKALASDGSLLVIGSTGTKFTEPENPEFYGGFLAKIDVDHSVLQSVTYFSVTPRSLQLDQSGNIFIAGETMETSLPGSEGSMQPTNQGWTDGFIIKLDPQILVLNSTFIGNDRGESFCSLKLDKNGNVVLAENWVGGDLLGLTGPDFPAPYTLVASFSNDLTTLNAVRSFDNGFSSICNDMEIDNQNNVYLASKYYSNSQDLPGFSNLVENHTVNWGAALIKLNPTLSGDPIYAKYFNMGLFSEPNQIRLSKDGGIYFSGASADVSDNIPLNEFGYPLSRGPDFFSKFDSQGNLVYLKRPHFDTSQFDLDRNDNIYFTGQMPPDSSCESQFVSCTQIRDDFTEQTSRTHTGGGSYLFVMGPDFQTPLYGDFLFKWSFDPQNYTYDNVGAVSWPFVGNLNEIYLSAFYVGSTPLTQVNPLAIQYSDLRYLMRLKAFYPVVPPIDLVNQNLTLPTPGQPLVFDAKQFIANYIATNTSPITITADTKFELEAGPHGAVMDMDTGELLWQSNSFDFTDLEALFSIKIYDSGNAENFSELNLSVNIPRTYDTSLEDGKSDPEKICLRLNYDLLKYKTNPNQVIQWDSTQNACILGTQVLFSALDFSSLSIGDILDVLIAAINAQWWFPGTITHPQIMADIGINTETTPISGLPIPGSLLPPPEPTVKLVTDSTVYFTDVPIGQSFIRKITLINQGNTSINITSITFSLDEFTASFSPQEIVSGGILEIPVTFRPTVEGARVASANISASSGLINVTLRGRGRIADAITDTIAPPLPQTYKQPFYKSYEFIYKGFEGNPPSQRGVSEGTIRTSDFAVLHGHINSTPIDLFGTKISIIDHPEYGYTTPHTDGNYDLVVNAGENLNILIERVGAKSFLRPVTPVAENFAVIPDIVFFSDYQQPTVTVSAKIQNPMIIQCNFSNEFLVIQPDTNFMMVENDTNSHVLDRFNFAYFKHSYVNDFTYTTLPAPEPPGFYAVRRYNFYSNELVVDDADYIQMDKAAYLYVRDELSILPVGSVVPTVSYKRSAHAWESAPNGLVIKIMQIQNGKAEVDIDGDGNADTLTALQGVGITESELANIATIFPSVLELTVWRIPVTKMSDLMTLLPAGPNP